MLISNSINHSVNGGITQVDLQPNELTSYKMHHTARPRVTVHTQYQFIVPAIFVCNELPLIGPLKRKWTGHRFLCVLLSMVCASSSNLEKSFFFFFFFFLSLLVFFFFFFAFNLHLQGLIEKGLDKPG